MWDFPHVSFEDLKKTNTEGFSPEVDKRCVFSSAHRIGLVFVEEKSFRERSESQITSWIQG